MKSLVDALEAEAAQTKAKAKTVVPDTAVPNTAEATAAKKGPPKSARRRSREFALQALYQWQVAAHSPGDLETQFGEADGFKRSDVTLFSVDRKSVV